MYSRYVVYFPDTELYLYTARTRVSSIDIAKKYNSIQAAKNAVAKSEWLHERYTIIAVDTPAVDMYD